jgi:serine/threonine protein kinase/tetratricopeptide (TPR) repeat protein
MVPSECLSLKLLGGYSAGTISAGDAETVEGHLSQCGECLSRLDALTQQPDSLVDALRCAKPASPSSGELQKAMDAVLSGNDAKRPTEASCIIGTFVGGYRIVEELGRGGMGRVYRAVHPRLDQEVALKVLRPGMDSAPILARFEAERQALALMDHPHIARVSDGGATEDGQPFFVMELVRGVPITRYCEQRGLGLRQRLELLIDVCQAVQHAHQKGIIHRDLKPSNILVAEYDARATPKVIDFGVARAIEGRAGHETEIGMLVGTPDYMSPEQADLTSRDVDTRSDIYSLGALLYELLVGVPPLACSRETPILERLRAIREEEPLPPSQMRSAKRGMRNAQETPHSAFRSSHWKELDWICLKALDKDRMRRYPTAVGLADDIRRFFTDEPIEAGPPSRGYRLKKFVRRNRVALTVTAAFAAVLFAATAISSALAWWANHERLRARYAEGEAVTAAEREGDARRMAETRLGQIEEANNILGAIFRDIDPRGREAVGEESLRLALGKRLDEAAAHIDEGAIGDPGTVAGLRERIGVAQLSLGRTNEALALLTMAAESRERLLGPDHDDTLQTRNALATALHAASRTQEMIEILEDVIRRHRSQPRESDDLLVGAMTNLSSGYRAAGRLREALALAEQAFQFRLAQLGAGHPDTINSRNTLAVAYRSAGDRTTAIRLTEENLSLQMTAYGPEHPDTVTSRSNLATLYAGAGRAAEALPHFEEILALRVRNSGSDHPDTLSSRDRLGECYRVLGRTAEALALHEETLKLRKRILGPLNPLVLLSQDHLGEVYVAMKRFPEAIAIHEETLRMRTSILGADHPETLASSDHLAIAYRRSGRVSDSIAQQTDTLARRKATLGEDHFDSQRSAGNLAHAYISNKQYQEAADVYRELVASRRRTLAADSPVLADTCFAFGQTLLVLQQGDQAEPLFRECLAIREKLEAGTWNTWNTRANLGEALLSQGQFASAEPLLVSAHEAMSQSLDKAPADSPARVARIASRLVQLYDAWHKPEEAAQWRAKSNPPSTDVENAVAQEQK